MPRRRRVLRIFKWTGTVVCVLILLAGLASLQGWCCAAIDGASWDIQIIFGTLQFQWADNWRTPWQLDAGFYDVSWQSPFDEWLKYGLWPRLETVRAVSYPGGPARHWLV